MSLLSTLYISSAGLTAFSNGLSTISSNVGNLNTPGYKRTELQFRDLGYHTTAASVSQGRLHTSQMSQGVIAQHSSINFDQGELRDTGQDTDLALDGSGFFVLQDPDSGQLVYTRIGQFEFNNQGYLVASDSGYYVTGLNASGQLVKISIRDLRAQDPQATTEVALVGNLSSASSAYTLNEIEVFDPKGGSHKLDLSFTNNSVNIDRSWLVNIRDEDGNLVLRDAQVRFNANASPAQQFNRITVTLSGDDFDSFSFDITLGDAGSFSGVTHFSTGTNSSVALDQQDGYAPGNLSEFAIDAEGWIQVTYSNEQSQRVIPIAIAQIDNPQQLQRYGNGLFIADADMALSFGMAGELGRGVVHSGSIELSNVELTQQFSDMIVVQRGYQASSQLLTVANEMIQQLLEATRSS